MYRVCYDTPGGVQTRDCDSFASVAGVLPHLANDFDSIWVREMPGGAIVLVYEKAAGLTRP